MNYTEDFKKFDDNIFWDFFQKLVELKKNKELNIYILFHHFTNYLYFILENNKSF